MIQTWIKPLILLAFLCFSQFSALGFISEMKFADKEKAADLLQIKDTYVSNLSKFDLASRYNNCQDQACLDQWLEAQAKSWTDEESVRIRKIARSIQNKINKKGYILTLPDTIWMVRTTGQEEGGSLAYTRKNFIVLGDMLNKVNDSILEHTITHELFHIISRHNPDLSQKLYNELGFTRAEIPNLSDELKALHISNPDAPDIGWKIQLTKGKKQNHYMLFLYASKPYKDGPFFNYIKLALLPCGTDTCSDKNDLVTFSEINGFFDQVGKNTKYVMHPEEILAENFAFSLQDETNLPSPEIPDMIRRYFKPKDK